MSRADVVKITPEIVRRMLGPIPPNCSSRDEDAHKATGWLIDPDGKPNPGGYLCKRHGEAIVAEFREKIGEEWRFIEGGPS